MSRKNTQLWELTTDEFTELLEKCYRRMEISPHSKKPRSITSDDEYVHGIAGIARLFGCSVAKAHKIKKSGIIDKAIVQIDRTITVNAKYALELAANKRNDSNHNINE